MARAADPLASYNAKRNFAKTAEPAGKAAKVRAKAGKLFLVQKHDATRLHYDLRLEVDGVLKSWAVTRGPSLDPDEKRLAVRTEDHPFDYGDFEGTIPKGEYGGGTVMLWDTGTWEPVEGKGDKDLEKGHLHFKVNGQRMRGEWLLIRLKPRPKEKRENWLLRKIADDEAGGTDDLVERELTSVKTGRTMQDIALDKKPTKAAPKTTSNTASLARSKGRSLAPPALAPPALAPPAFTPPQLATLVDHVPAGGAWIHEMKYDGYRCLLSLGGGKARIFTRTGLDWTDRFGEIANEAATLPVGSALIDGEIVFLDSQGNASFSGLQGALKSGKGVLTLFAFDLLHLDGEDLSALPNIQRKERMRAILPKSLKTISFAEHIVGAGEKLFDAMCAAGQEGIVSKRADAPYAGRRTKNWLKIKCTRRQEFVIIGWARSAARGRGFASLLLGLHEDGKLRYAGRVGTGFSGDTIERLSKRLAALAQDKPALDVPRGARRGAQWVKPELVAEIAFAEFTADKVVRHASFIGLREDKPARNVGIEEPQPVDAGDQPVKISNPGRVIFPETGLTKGDLADYYQAIAPLMLPVTARRPISLVRCPQGRAKQCFFQKHDAGSFGAHVHKIPIREKDGGHADYLYVDDAAGLAACVQMGTIEFHGWGARVDDVERPDRMIFDLDPDEGLDFAAVRKAAEDIKRHLADIGLVSFPMLSGGKGIHVVVPLRPDAGWPAVKDFSHRFSLALAEAEPDRFTAALAKAKRKGRIFIDYLRNQRGATAVMPYSARARARAPVAAPVTWRELGDFDTAAAFTIRDVKTLIRRAASAALAGWGDAAQQLPDV